MGSEQLHGAPFMSYHGISLSPETPEGILGNFMLTVASGPSLELVPQSEGVFSGWHHSRIFRHRSTGLYLAYARSTRHDLGAPPSCSENITVSSCDDERVAARYKECVDDMMEKLEASGNDLQTMCEAGEAGEFVKPLPFEEIPTRR